MLDFEKVFRDFITNFLKYPQDLKIEKQEGSKSVVLNIYANKEDVGKLIGLQGRNVKALKTLASSLGNIHGRRLSLFIMD